MRGLHGTVVVVAGGAGGIGTATSLRLGEEGASVVVGDLNEAAAHEVARRITAAGGRAVAASFDVADDASVAALFEAADAAFGGVDCVHANAADLSVPVIMGDTDALDVDLDVWDRTLAVNLRGFLLCTRHAIPRLLERGGGAIVYTSSAASFVGEPARPSYAAAKSGVNALMRHVASRWGKQRVRANAVAPGLVVSDEMSEVIPQDLQQRTLKGTRSWRLGHPRDIAAMVAFLMSDDGEWINGQVISVDGGVTLR
ncbi:MAG TPA: SDR family oxidoreductase [Acidimicrobiales bacterium]|jgi:NAD(P)-dependent dehydrogenase (short-subunit alcohol dehydrogenase family)|nr:SDR family oxidoreductase [Acidimicrobiales bacterium]